MDMYSRKQTNPQYSNRIDKEEVIRLYQQREKHKISLNDQLENFYNKCKNNRFFKHEVAYFFHAELLPVDELQQYQNKFHQNLIRQNEADTWKALIVECDSGRNRFRENFPVNFFNKATENRSKFEKELIRSKNSEYRLYGGIRATFIFFPRYDLPTQKELNMLCEKSQQMMYTQLWRKWTPINIPKSIEEIDVIGFEKHTFQDEEDLDFAFPPMGNSASEFLNPAVT